ncbi:hypothetical protein M3Y99_00926100 [Aphelenchoides fujianensis]|nr:hypothetical protein M3Y99_00926100 [Aphelenchoides fujianensis]
MYITERNDYWWLQSEKMTSDEETSTSAAPERAAAKPRISANCYVKSQFSTAQDAECFVTNGRLILAFSSQVGWFKQVPVLDTFYGMEIMLNSLGLGDVLLRKVLSGVQIEEDCSLQQTEFLLLALDQWMRPHLQLMAVDFAAKSFEIKRDLPLSFGDSSVASVGKILRTSERDRFVVVVGDKRRNWAFRYDHKEGTVRAFHDSTVEISGHFFDFQVHSNQLVCVRHLPPVLERKRPEIHVRFVDLESGAQVEAQKAAGSLVSSIRALVDTCMAGDFLYVFTKNDVHTPIRPLRLRLPDGQWEAVASEPFGLYDFGRLVSCFQQGVWSLHCLHTWSMGGQTVEQFRSYRIPLSCPDRLAFRSWFSLLKQADVKLDVPKNGPCRLLSPTGLFLNKVVFANNERILIRRDIDACNHLLQFAPTSSKNALHLRALATLPEDHGPERAPDFPRADDWEQAALQAAIEESLRTFKLQTANKTKSGTGTKERSVENDREQADVQKKPVKEEVDYEVEYDDYGETDDEEDDEEEEEEEPEVNIELPASPPKHEDASEESDDADDWEIVS